jgi:taurine dioxygenase
MSNTGTHHAAVAPAIIRPSVVKTSIKAERVAVALGAEISNVNLADAGKDGDQIKEIRALLLQHKVLFFRDQDITPMEHQTFAEQFGELDIHALLPMHPEAPKILPLHHNYEKGDKRAHS